MYGLRRETKSFGGLKGETSTPAIAHQRRTLVGKGTNMAPSLSLLDDER